MECLCGRHKAGNPTGVSRFTVPDWEHPVPMAVVLPLHLDFPDSAIRMATSEKLRTGKNEIIIQCCKKINFK